MCKQDAHEMSVSQPWHQRASAAVDYGCASSIYRIGGNTLNEIALNEDVGILNAPVFYTVKKEPGL